MHQLLEQNISEHQLLEKGERVLIGVSGGVDSMVLLTLLNQLSTTQCWKLAVAHFNHQLRGVESNEDCEFVRAKAQLLGLPFFSERAEIPALARKEGISIEMAARKVRMDFLGRSALQFGARKIALAHHRDDQVELFWLRLLRGNAGEGLGGMEWINSLPVARKPEFGSIQLVRPMLNMAKETLVEFARAQGLEFREDSTNAVPGFDRNRLRLEILPWLEKHQPALRDTTLRLAEVLGAEKEWLREQAEEWLRTRREIHAPVCDEKPFKKLHAALQREIVFRQLIEAGVGPNFSRVETLREKPRNWISVGAGQKCALGLDGLIELRRESSAGFGQDDYETTVDLNESGLINLNGLEISWRRAGKRTAETGMEFFDSDRIGPRVTFRYWRQGDRFQPIGMHQPVKLQDIFMNAHLPRAERHLRLIGLNNEGEIFWVQGFRIGERFKVTEETDNILAFRFGK